MKTKIAIIALALATLTSCDKEQSRNESLAATFSSSITTRVSGTEWEEGDEVGIMVTSENTLLNSYHYNNHHTVSFTDPEQGIFTPATDLDQIYFSVEEDVYVDFYAYYPYSERLVEEEQSYPIDIVDQTSPKAIDFMEASTFGGDSYNKNSGTVELAFSRNMAKISMTLKAGTGLSLSDISAVRLEGFYTTATYDFPTNSFTALGGDSTDITPYSAGDNSYSAIVIPENSASQMVYFTTPHGDVPLDLSSYTLAKGEHLSFTVTVSQTVATHSTNPINGWDDIDVDDDSFDTE